MKVNMILFHYIYFLKPFSCKNQNNETPQRDTPTRTPGSRASTTKFDRLTLTIDEEDYTHMKNNIKRKMQRGKSELKKEDATNTVLIDELVKEIEENYNWLVNQMDSVFNKKRAADEKRQQKGRF